MPDPLAVVCCSTTPQPIDTTELTHTNLDDSRIARAGFARGLCANDDTLVAASSSPSTIALHDLVRFSTHSVVTLSYDIRNAIRGLEVWPFGNQQLSFSCRCLECQ